MSSTISEESTIRQNTSKIIKDIIVAAPATTTASVGSNNNSSSYKSEIVSPLPSNIEEHCRLLEAENQNLKETQTRLQQQCTDFQRRERILMRKLANKEQELRDYISQIAEYKAAQAPGPVALRASLLDPAINLLFEKLKHELQMTKAKLEETQNELSAWKFTPDSNTGKRLMAKCRLLYQENEELGKMTTNGRLAKLESELAMQKSFSEEVKKSQSELDDFLQEIDEDVEGMQSTILYLQQELRTTRDRIQFLEKENLILKNSNVHLKSNGQNELCPSDIETKVDNLMLTSDDNNIENIPHNENCNDENSSFKIKNLTNSTASIDRNEFQNLDNIEMNNEVTLQNSFKEKTKLFKKREYESDSSGESDSKTELSVKQCNNKKLRKKTRSSSVLSIDLNEEDTKIEVESDENDMNSNEKIVTRRKSTRNFQNGEN